MRLNYEKGVAQMAKAHSNYLNADFEVNFFEAMEDGKTIMILAHETLEDILYNKIDPALKVNCQYKPLFISLPHCVFLCTISDVTGRNVQAIGETTGPTLETETAQNYPALMASKRAFDRATMRYLALDLSDKTLSSAELNPAENAIDNGISAVDITEEIQRGKTQGAYEPQNERKSNEGVSVTGRDKNAYAPRNGLTDDVSSVSTRTDNYTGKQKGVSGDPGAVLCEIGTFRGKNLTVATVFAENAGYVNWIANKYTPKTEEQKRVKAACIDFLASQQKGVRQ